MAKVCLECLEVVTGTNINPNYRGIAIHYGQDWYCGAVVEIADEVLQTTISKLEQEKKERYAEQEGLIHLSDHLSDLQAVADKLAERLKANKEVIETHVFDNNGYIHAHKDLIFGSLDAEALSAYEKLMEQK